MDLARLEKVWNRLGRRDPYWAALTQPDKEDGGWLEEEFFSTGEEEIAGIFRWAEQRGWSFARQRALDFGCGAGRLTQALATRFDQVDGVDIAPSMLAVARRQNRHGERCRYHYNATPDLCAFEDATYDFIYSALTLQHVPPDYARRYVPEFVRVLASGGLLIFQLPSHTSPVEPAAATSHTLAGAKLPRSAFRAEVSLDCEPLTMTAREKRLIAVTARNLSDHVWSSLGRDDGLYRIQVGDRWLSGDGKVVRANDGRAPLPHDVPPGGEARVFLEITAPDVNGDYRLAVDLVQEHVAWFEEQGCRAAVVECTVERGQPPVLTTSNRRRFGVRYPRLHRLLVSLGLDAVRGGLRRKIERGRNARRQRASMVMCCVPRSEVVTLLTAAGGRVLDVTQDLLPGGYQTCQYWVTKP